MQILTRDTYPLTALGGETESLLGQIQGTKSPLYFTVADTPRAVLLDAEEYERLRHLAALASEEEGIRQGEEDIEMGRVYPAEIVLEEIRQKLGLPR